MERLNTLTPEKDRILVESSAADRGNVHSASKPTLLLDNRRSHANLMPHRRSEGQTKRIRAAHPSELLINRDEMKRLTEQGASFREIAKAGASTGTVRERLQCG